MPRAKHKTNAAAVLAAAIKTEVPPEKPAIALDGFLDDFPFSTNPDGVAAIIRDGKMRKFTREELLELIEKATIGGV
jgi:hypothetical protein